MLKDSVGDYEPNSGLHEPIRFSTEKIRNSLYTVGILHHTPLQPVLDRRTNRKPQPSKGTVLMKM